MKNIVKIVTCLAIVTALSGIITSCTDFLDKQPPSAISSDDFWINEDNALRALVGCYRTENDWTDRNFTSPIGLMRLEFAGGNGTEKDERSISEFASISVTASSSNIAEYWENTYKKIAYCNDFLDNIDVCPMDEAKKAIWKAEVKTIRTYYFFLLAFHWKDVPMPLHVLTIEEANSIAQTPQAEVYAQIESDLKESITLLKDQYTGTEYGRFTKGVARMMLGRTYLAQNKWDEAAAAFKEVINSQVYKLDRRNGDDSYEKMFQLEGANSPEMIWTWQFAENQYWSKINSFQPPEMYGGWHNYAPYNEVVQEYFCTDGKDIQSTSLYNEDDPYANREIRLYATFFLPAVGSFPGTFFLDKTYDCFTPGEGHDYFAAYVGFNGLGIKKHLDPVNNSSQSNGNAHVHWPMMRYAETLLSYLEAVNEATPGSVDQALLDLTINDVRDRVKLSPILKTDIASQEALRKIVRQERRVELAFEGLRLYDVHRWGVSMTELNRVYHGVKLSSDPTARNYKGDFPVDENNYYLVEPLRKYAEHNRYVPIPQRDIDVNKSLKQNAGH